MVFHNKNHVEHTCSRYANDSTTSQQVRLAPPLNMISQIPAHHMQEKWFSTTTLLTQQTSRLLRLPPGFLCRSLPKKQKSMSNIWCSQNSEGTSKLICLYVYLCSSNPNTTTTKHDLLTCSILDRELEQRKTLNRSKLTRYTENTWMQPLCVNVTKWTRFHPNNPAAVMMIDRHFSNAWVQAKIP